MVVTGPTAAGKTAAALELAERFGGEIINADSQQVYIGMDIGTAKPTPEERARVRHHLLDVVRPDVRYNAGRYGVEARLAAEDIHARGRRVFLCGGTGLYIRSFLEGLSAEVGGRSELRAELEAEHEKAVAEGDPERLHRRLAKGDPERAAQLHPNDVVRLVRAIELLETTGRRPSELRCREARASPFRALHLALDPGEKLRERIDVRCEVMVEQGLLWEVRRLREEGYGPELPSMQAIGYRHMQPVVDGTATLASILPLLKRDTWQLARRQRTWLRAVPEARWIDPSAPGAAQQLADEVEAFLSQTG
ncbi:MAG: tRNA (adenosine(37)-N6)-dimethylallyltransferase MiaA [Myxococcota bacterium]|nr:tRNA (adenosine(37)-N6)-dimethylallyltransferase MiaA [Myxococcota bacterium]